MATVIQPFALRGDTAANWTAANPVLKNKQEGYETDTRKRKVGDGVTPWNSLQYDAAEASVDKSDLVTGGSTRVSGGAFHFFNDPAVTPTNPEAGDVWVGDLA